MDNRKIYCYHKLEPIDILDSVEWARENYHRFDGETSPLWNEHVQKEFARLKRVHSDGWRQCWERSFRAIANDIELTNMLEEIKEN